MTSPLKNKPPTISWRELWKSISRKRNKSNYKNANISDRDWEKLPGVLQCNALFKTLKNIDGKSWRDDTAKTARRVWEWWRTIRCKFLYLPKLVAQIGLIQTFGSCIAGKSVVVSFGWDRNQADAQNQQCCNRESPTTQTLFGWPTDSPSSIP